MTSIYANPYNQSIKINGFSIGIAAGVPVKKILRQGATYFSMPDLTEYKLLLSNDNVTRCDVTVYIDDNEIGTWRLNPRSSISIERPANIPKKFVLIKEGTNIAYQSGIGTYDTNGLIRAVFKPELLRPKRQTRYEQVVRNPQWTLGRGRYENDSYDETYQIGIQDISSKRITTNNMLAPAGTGLGNYSNQQFGKVNKIFNVDRSNITTINIRLVVEEETNIHPSHLVSLRKYLHTQEPKTNAIPPKINGYDYDYDYDNGLYYGNSDGFNSPDNNYYYDYSTDKYFLLKR